LFRRVADVPERGVVGRRTAITLNQDLKNMNGQFTIIFWALTPLLRSSRYQSPNSSATTTGAEESKVPNIF